MLNVYDKNGLPFWTHEEIAARRLFEDRLSTVLFDTLKKMNRAWDAFRVEAPLLTPGELVNQQYLTGDMMFQVANTVAFGANGLVLRPETTMGSYAYAKWLLTHHTGTKLPFVVWQHGKSFRNEQDQVTKNMRLKEFYQLEFQCLYGLTTGCNYAEVVIPVIQKELSRLLGPCREEDSDRIPDYAYWTKDVVLERNGMELCSISLRKDFEGANNLEVAVGTDRCVWNFLQESAS